MRGTDQSFWWNRHLFSHTESSRIKISFFPARQVLHTRSNLKIFIEDKDGIPEEAQIRLHYNGYDVTDSFLSLADFKITDSRRRTLQIDFKNMKLPAFDGNKIEVSYARFGESPDILKSYPLPVCDAISMATIKNTHPFRPPQEWIDKISELSTSKRFNPNFYAGLIAHESGFNHKTLSAAKALGLSQITPLADKQISSSFPDWPRYASLESTPVLILKSMIFTGALSENDDWRLNPELSLEGGARYIEELSRYWNLPENRALFKRYFGEDNQALTKVLLASYHSGPARVVHALKNRGTEFLLSENLSNARLYVIRTLSYCYHFGQEDET
jgi:hypothetical protein